MTIPIPKPWAFILSCSHFGAGTWLWGFLPIQPQNHKSLSWMMPDEKVLETGVERWCAECIAMHGQNLFLVLFWSTMMSCDGVGDAPAV